MDVHEAVRRRRSTKRFDPAHAIDDAVLKELFALVVQAPSSYNLQHARYVVVRDPERRQQLRRASYGQRHVGEASAVVVVCAKLHAHEDAARANGHAPPEVLDGLVPLIERSYADRPRLQRDEAIRSASLGAMVLMLAAEEMGLSTCAMIGFKPDDVARIVGLPDGHIVVMLVAVGRAGPAPHFPTSRFPLSETVRLDSFDGAGLA